MATNFPSSLDSFTNPTATDTLDSPPHDQQHANVNDAVEAIETALLDGAPLHIDDANERVGVGNTSPSYRLDVTGDINASGDIKLAGDSMPRGIVGSDVLESNVSLTVTGSTTHTVTFTAVSGRKYFAMFSGLLELSNTAGAIFRYDINVSGSRRAAGRLEPANTSDVNTANVMVELPPVSGSTTVTMGISMTAGTGQLTASNTVRSTLIVLDVGT